MYYSLGGFNVMPGKNDYLDFVTKGSGSMLEEFSDS